MGSIRAFLLGVVVGATFLFVSLKYYVVRAEDGLHWIPKATAELSIPYVDIRGFQMTDWNERRDLLLAIVQAEQGHLLQDAAYSGLRHTMEGVIDSLRGPTTAVR